MQIYLIISARQPKRGDSYIWCWMTKKPECCTYITAQFGLKWIHGMIYAMGNGTLNLEKQQTELAKHKPEYVGVQ